MGRKKRLRLLSPWERGAVVRKVDNKRAREEEGGREDEGDHVGGGHQDMKANFSFRSFSGTGFEFNSV